MVFSEKINYLKIAIILTSASLLISLAVYMILEQFVSSVFGGIYRMFMYHEEYPIQYLLIISVTFGFCGSYWLNNCRKTPTLKRFIAIFFTIIFSIVLALPFGGLLWAIHDMQAGYFPPPRRLINALIWGVSSAVQVGWLVLLLSFPFNLIGLCYGFLVLHYGGKILDKVA